MDPSTVNSSLQKFNILFNDPRSPIMSALQTVAQYKGDKGLVSFHKMYRDLDDFVNNRIDLAHFQREQKQLEAVANEVGKAQGTIKQLQSYILKETQEHNKELPSVASPKTVKSLSAALEQRVKQQYNEFKQAAAKGGAAEDFSREQKLSLMRDVYSTEFGTGSFASIDQVFPAFYAQDLIVFGLEHDSVEAVRLGERVMSENGYVLSLELQKAVKAYTVANAERYQKAIKKTGPIDNTSLYRARPGQHKGEASTIMNMDDPYWQEFIDRNAGRSQQWRVPSHLAWNHKPYGIASELYDVSRVKEVNDQFRRYFQ